MRANGPERFANRSVLPSRHRRGHSRRRRAVARTLRPGSHSAQEENPMTHRQLVRRAIPFAAAAILGIVLAPSVPTAVAAQDDVRGPDCNTRTLRGSYGL